MIVKRGDIWSINLEKGQGSKQGGVRPCLVLQNDTGNKYAPTTIIAPISTALHKAKLPTHVILEPDEGSGLSIESFVMLEQITTIDKKNLQNRFGILKPEVMKMIGKAARISLGI